MIRIFSIVVIGFGLLLTAPGQAQQYITTKDTPVDATTLASLKACVVDARKGPHVDREIFCRTNDDKKCTRQAAARDAAEKASIGKSHVYHNGEVILAQCLGKSAQHLYDRWAQLGTVPTYTNNDPGIGLDGCTCSKDAKSGDVACEVTVDELTAEAFSCYGHIENKTRRH
ncbi:hypothetical protein J4G48_0040800 [Bradyrhizobium barranii subsp. apii]|uniref:hypothetical protein n=1 Tax=Bradyrhizobium barranii TaxID=2992140 RepID=UPI001AA18817|nr:hypothetical protein [Bradyrhizobium barranii]UPT95497.1 hypothetical protein J4G48_0040800 [Bradyrhizobium barranii subsp. apii]